VVDDRALEEERPIHEVVQVLPKGAHLLHLFLPKGPPEVIAIHIVRVCVMIVVRELPAIVGEDERPKGDRADNLVEQTRARERLVRTVVAEDEEARRRRPEEDPGEWQQEPRRNRD